MSCADILALPYPETESLDLSENEKLIVNDIVDYQRDLIRLGEDSDAMKLGGYGAVSKFANIFAAQINAVYKKPAVRPLEAQRWPGALCVPFAFGEGNVDWTDADSLQSRLDSLLHEKNGTTLRVNRITCIYDNNFVFLLKPERLRYWLPSVALRDADETLADLRMQGF